MPLSEPRPTYTGRDRVRDMEEEREAAWKATDRFRAKREHLERLEGLVPERQGHNLAWAASSVPCSLTAAAFKDPRDIVRDIQNVKPVLENHNRITI